MASVSTPAKKLRAKICLLNSAQFDNWKDKDLPRLLTKYPKFNYVRLVDASTGKNYVWYKIR